MKKALIVIDVQNYLINERTKHLPKKIAEFITKSDFDVVIFTKFVNKETSSFARFLGYRKAMNPPDIDIHKDLVEFISDRNVFDKSTYSAFQVDKFREFLEKNDIRELYFCGMDTDACILASAFSAFDFGYIPHVLKELSLSHSGEEMDSSAIKIIEHNLEKKQG